MSADATTATTATTACYLMGGLGNQLFQIFTTLAYAIKHRTDFIFPYSKILTVGITRPTYWDTIFARLENKTTKHAANLLEANHQIITNYTKLNERRYYEYTELSPPPAAAANQLLVGYFQNRQYFAKEFDEVADFLDIPIQRAEIYDEYKCLFEGEYTISLHFRIGDYATKPEYHPILSAQYYEDALTYILETRGRTESEGRGARDGEGTSVFYFCEKESASAAQKVVGQLQKKFPRITFFKVDDTIPDWKQMFIMSLCNDHIIANSTFSWWGAVFNPRVEKIVCYPREWLGPKMRDYSVAGLIFPDWVGF